jgi:hypothetical protein
MTLGLARDHVLRDGGNWGTGLTSAVHPVDSDRLALN